LNATPDKTSGAAKIFSLTFKYMISSLYTHFIAASEWQNAEAEERLCPVKKTSLESFFAEFRRNILGQQQMFESPFGEKKMIYADWTATGKAYQPIEECLQQQVMPFLANTHTETTISSTLMSKAYNEAKLIIKEHVHATNQDVLIFCGSGMTSAVNKLQRILGLKISERTGGYMKKGLFMQVDEVLRPIVFVTHMEHHSNQTSWLETIADVEIIQSDSNGNVDLKHFENLLEKFKDRKNKIAAVTACSNVTGIQTPYHKIAQLIHEYGGLCFVDFAASAPYVKINMHPKGKDNYLDAIYFSPHKFLGGPGTPGVLIFNKKIYTNGIPDQPGGGTVVYSNPWKKHEYITDIEQREDGGTPPFLMGIKAAMCVKLKEQMGVDNILQREEEILEIIYDRLSKIKNVEVFETQAKKRLGIISFIIKEAHYNLIVKILNDRFGIQTRGGCSCAGTYGHFLLQVDKVTSNKILNEIRSKNFLFKPGWIRLSVHPTMTNADVHFIMDGIELTALHFKQWSKAYTYNAVTNEYLFNSSGKKETYRIGDWFDTTKWK
jgi:selenocysteine lyase/cysteine desulfurase